VKLRIHIRSASVRVRTTVAAITVVAVALVGVSFWLVAHQSSSLTENIQTTSILRAQDLVSALQEGTLPVDLAVQIEDSGFVQVVDSSGNVVASSTNVTGELPIDPKPHRDKTRFAYTLDESPAGDSSFRVVGLQTQTSIGLFTVYVGSSLEPVSDATSSLISALLLVMPLLVLFVGLVTWLVISLAMRPVDSITKQVDEITSKDLHRRVPEPRSSDEISDLAKTMNKMLERLEDSDRRQRSFIGDVSHELRSPLTGLRAQLEVHQAHPNTADWREVTGEVLEEVTRMEQLIGDMLLLATVDSGQTQIVYETIDLNQIVAREVNKLSKNSKIHFELLANSSLWVEGSALHLARLVRNLLENADRFARANVTVRLSHEEHVVRLEVCDDGPGIPTDARETIFGRFTRLDESRSRPSGGAGLGLTIVREIALLHHATVWVEDNAPGARFIVEFAEVIDSAN